MTRAILLAGALALAAPAHAVVLDMLTMDEPTAQQLTAQSETDADGPRTRLEPRLVDAGPYAGSYVLPARVRDDPAFVAERDALAALPVVSIDTDAAWPDPDA